MSFVLLHFDVLPKRFLENRRSEHLQVHLPSAFPFSHHDFVQFGKQLSRYKTIWPSIVLSQQRCDETSSLFQ